MRGISELKIKINEVQESYVGIGLGLIKKEIVEKDGLIIQFEEM